MRLSRGEYEPSDETAARMGCVRPSVLLSRLLFFLAVMLLRPELAEDLFRLARRLPKVVSRPFEDLDRFVGILEQLRPMVAKHCAQHIGINEGWFTGIACVFVFVSRWHSEGRSIVEFFLDVEPLLNAAAETWWPPGDNTIPTPEPWNPTLETLAEFSERMRDFVAAYIKTTIGHGESEATASGYVKVPDRRDLEPFFWLAGFQTRGWSMERIWRAVHKDSSTVRKQIQKLAGEIMLPLRDPEEYDSSQTQEIIREALDAVTLNKIVVTDVRVQIPELLTSILPPGILQLIQ